MGSAFAVGLNPHGTGQVLLFPYYTVNGGNTTLFSVVNSTAHAKAVRVRVAEGENGRDTASINIYLVPHDTWVAAIVPPQPSFGGAAAPVLTTQDNTCTVPPISNYANSPYSWGTGGVILSNAAFSGGNADASGDSAITRESEGTIEVIEMGTLVDGSISAQAAGRAVAGSAEACNVLYDAWAPIGDELAVSDVPNLHNGYWVAAPNTDLKNPTGGLYGTGYVINVADGTIYAYTAIALDGFRSDPADQPPGTSASVVLHTEPGSAAPNLSSAISDPVNGVATAYVFANGGPISASYPASTRAVDAVSATLIADTLYNEFTTDSNLAARTSWLLSYPTRRFYTDPAITGGAAITPFTRLFGGPQQNIVTESVTYSPFDRNGQPPVYFCPAAGCDYTLRLPGTTVEVINFRNDSESILSSALNANFSDSSTVPIANDGTMQIGLDQVAQAAAGAATSAPTRFMRTSADGRLFVGLPVIGFAVQNFANGNLQGGILASYPSVLSHRTDSECYTSTAAVQQCQ
jgi:hypothetical protein